VGEFNLEEIAVYWTQYQAQKSTDSEVVEPVYVGCRYLTSYVSINVSTRTQLHTLSGSEVV
jgi:hypothetical protein